MSATFQLPTDLFLLKHPFYQAWVDGKLNLSTLKDYAEQYYHHVAAFPQYLEQAAKICVNSEARTVLEENLADENGEGYGTPHPELWLQFAEGVGASRTNVFDARLRSGITKVVQTFTDLSKASFAQSLGALYAYESQVPEIAESKINGLRAHYGINDAKTLSFFEVHRVADVEHRQRLLKVIETLPELERKQAEQAAAKACQALWDFLTDVQIVNQISCA